MYFDYSLYVDVCLIDALQGFVPTVILSIVFLKLFYVKILKERDFSYYNWFSLFIVIICIGIFLLQCGGKLVHGIHLIKETEKDEVEVYGEISNMKEIGDFNRRFVKYEYGYDEISGTVFTIDGIKCTAPLNCGLEVGDYVTVRYLPKSGYILYISKVDDS